MMIAVNSPVVYSDEEGLKVYGRVAAMDGPNYLVITSIGAEWRFNVGDITAGRLRIDERKLEGNIPTVTEPKSDLKNDGPYFWRNGTGRDGQAQFSSALSSLTPHWCDWHEWAVSETPCPVCETGQFL